MNQSGRSLVFSHIYSLFIYLFIFEFVIAMHLFILLNLKFRKQAHTMLVNLRDNINLNTAILFRNCFVNILILEINEYGC